MKIQINKLNTNQKSKQPKIQQNKTTLVQLQSHYYLHGLLGLSSLFLVYTSVTPIATAMVLLYRFYCIFVYHVLIILDLYFASWAAVKA